MATTPPRVRRSIPRISGVMLGVVLLAAWGLHALGDWGRLAKARKSRALAAASLVAPQAGPLLVRKIDTPLHRWTRALKNDPAVRLVAVHDKNGEIRAIEADSATLARRAVWAEGMMAGLYEPVVWHAEDEDGQPVCGAMVPIRIAPDEPPVGQLTMAFRVDADASAGAPSLWTFYAPLGLVALLAWGVGNQEMTRRVVEPFSRLARRARRSGTDLPDDHDDALGDVAGAFKKLHGRIDHWRDEAKKLRLTLERRVADRTKDYLKETRRAVRQAEIDPLTGLNNRRVIDNDLDRIVTEHIEQGTDMSVVMVDLDNFKTLNDTLGHSAGDEMLVFVGQLLGKSLRQDDLAARLGGDEFVLVLPETSAESTERLAQRLVALFGQSVKTLPRLERAPSLSMGVASLQTTGADTGKQLLSAADAALYQAKSVGKGCVIVVQSASTPATS